MRRAHFIPTGLSTALAVLVALAPAAASAAAPGQAGTVVARYSFNQGFGSDGAVADDSGNGHRLSVRSAGGHVGLASGPSGLAAVFPGRCEGARCPRAILEGPTGGRFNPGSGAFRYGATLMLRPNQTGRGENVAQKGYANRGSQWKLQIDGVAGRPSCVLTGRGDGRIFMARSPVSVADGQWHRLECRRSGGQLSIAVDDVTRGSVTIPTGLHIANTLPVRIGGKHLNPSNDQFSGVLDEVYFVVG